MTGWTMAARLDCSTSLSNLETALCLGFRKKVPPPSLKSVFDLGCLPVLILVELNNDFDGEKITFTTYHSSRSSISDGLQGHQLVSPLAFRHMVVQGLIEVEPTYLLR